jgi:hypothetical protein
VFEVLANVCRNPQEALRQFVENAADAIEQVETDEGHIKLTLQYEPGNNGQKNGDLRSIAIQDNGTGMTLDKMRDVLHRIGDSDKINLALRGEQGIGLLAFALIANEMHLASTAKDGTPSSCLVLKRPWLKKAHAELIEHCPRHEHANRGTIAYLEGILPEIAPQLSKGRIKDYLGQQFASDLRSNLYTMSISDGGDFEHIHPQRFRGVRVMANKLHLGKSATAFVELYVLPWEIPDASINLYGRGGARICLLTELDDFKGLPWADKRLEGYVRCDRLKRTADKTAVVQDSVFRSFVTELRKVEPRIQQLILETSAESQERRFNIIFNRVDRLIDKFLRYRERGLLAELPGAAARAATAETKRATTHPSTRQEPPVEDTKPGTTVRHTSDRVPYIRLQPPPQDKGDFRSWFDPGQSIICINREHAEFLTSQREDRRCVRYLFSIWAKETLLQQYGAQAEKVADEMVGLLAEAEPLLW